MAYGYSKKLKTIIVDHHPLINDRFRAFSAHEIHIINDHGVEGNDNIYWRKLIAWIGGHIHEVECGVTKRDGKRVAHYYCNGAAHLGDYVIYNVYDDILNMDINPQVHLVAGQPGIYIITLAIHTQAGTVAAVAETIRVSVSYYSRENKAKNNDLGNRI